MIASILAYDRKVALAMARINSRVLNIAAAVLGSEVGFVLLFAAVMSWLVFARSFSLFRAMHFGLFLIFLEIAVWVLKIFFKRPRPAESMKLPDKLPFYPKHPGMPSGVAAQLGYFAVLIGTAYPDIAMYAHAVALSFAFLRVYSGSHYLSDVMAGYVLGCVFAGAAFNAEGRPM